MRNIREWQFVIRCIKDHLHRSRWIGRGCSFIVVVILENLRDVKGINKHERRQDGKCRANHWDALQEHTGLWCWSLRSSGGLSLDVSSMIDDGLKKLRWMLNWFIQWNRRSLAVTDLTSSCRRRGTKPIRDKHGIRWWGDSVTMATILSQNEFTDAQIKYILWMNFDGNRFWQRHSLLCPQFSPLPSPFDYSTRVTAATRFHLSTSLASDGRMDTISHSKWNW